jgi:DNA ligase (NAD+)
MSQDIQQQLDQLRDQIRDHDYRYYVLAEPIISDLEYDRLMKQLVQLEQAYPLLVTPDSPTQRIGDAPLPQLEQFEHRIPMLSIENCFSQEELKTFGRKIEMEFGAPQEWIVELKIDGVAASLIYERGVLIKGLTRGNGKVGDDITHNLRTMRDVPLRLKTDSPPEILEVRGEVYMLNSDLVKLNQRQAQAGGPQFKNTRNVAAGAIRLLDSKITATRKLRMFCHGVGYCEGLNSTNHIEFLQEIASFGLIPTPFVQVFPSIEAAAEHCDQLIESLHELDFEVDGMVVKLNQFQLREELGARSKSPRWLIAYKWEKYEGVTRVESIEVQVGKTGTITPVANLTPVELAGTTVSRASLHNADEIARKDIRVGDVVVVEKAGKIIPHIVRVEKHKRGPRPPAVYRFPVVCPQCQTRLVKDEGGVYIRCPNQLNCPAQWKERLRFFATRDAMDIEGLGDKLVDQLVNQQLVNSFGDLYRLTVQDLMELDRMGKKSAEKLITAIQSSKSRGMARLLNALSIRHVGTTVAQVLAKHFQSIDRLLTASETELGQVKEIGPAIAKSIAEFISSEEGGAILADLKNLGLKWDIDQSAHQIAGTQLAGKSFVITGSLEKYTREEAERLIESYGGKIASSVTSKTSYLVVGERPGSKLAKAQTLRVPVLHEDELQKMIDDFSASKTPAEDPT